MAMEKMAAPFISREELAKHIENVRGDLRRITRAYNVGRLSEGERFNRFETVISEGFLRYLESRGLECRHYIKPNWHRFLEDHELYKKNMAPDSPIEEPWLRYRDPHDREAVYEANTADKVSFFILMEEFHIPVEYFQPLPEHCIVPDQRLDINRRKTEAYIGYRLADAGGLDTEKDPLGKTFTLVDEHGLKAELEVRWKVFVTAHNTAYYAFGTIEGYTSARKRQIEISSIENNRIRFFTRLENDDTEAFEACPLWEEYRKANRQWYDLQQEVTQKLIERYEELAF